MSPPPTEPPAASGREVLLALALPLPMLLATDLMRAVQEVAERHGYTDVVLLTDGTNRIAAIPPATE